MGKRKRHFDEDSVPKVVKDLGELRLNMARALANAKDDKDLHGVYQYGFEALIMLFANYVGEVEGDMENLFCDLLADTDEVVSQHERLLHNDDLEEDDDVEGLDDEDEVEEDLEFDEKGNFSTMIG